MESENKGLPLLSGNALKVIAAVSMAVDHIGYLILPQITILRIIGRFAFPIFAFMIAQGCRYTKNKKRYLATISVLAAVCQIVYYIADKSLYMCVLVTFSLSIVMIYALQYFKKMVLSPESTGIQRLFAAFVFVLSVTSVYILNRIFIIDYGFWGCMVPVFAALFQPVGAKESECEKKLNHNWLHVLTLSGGLILLAAERGGVQPFSLLAVPLLLLYSGKRGRLNMKYFFYIFYPLHLVIIQGIAMLIS